MSEPNKLKIYVFPLPAMGHINPLSCILREVVDSNKATVVCFGMDVIKPIIESSGAEYRSYEIIRDEPPSNPKFGDLFNIMLNATSANYRNLAAIIEDEKPDLIIYDEMAMFLKFTFLHLAKKHRNSKTFTMPPAIMFRSGFGSQEGVYPNKIEDGLIEKTFADMISLIKPGIRLIFFNLRHGFGIYNLFKFMWFQDEKLNLVCVFPELHPRAHLFTKVNKFVGICLKEEVRTFKTLDEKLQSFIDAFEPVNPLQTGIASRESHLIFTSLGTVFNKQEGAFVTIIEGLKSLEDQHKYKMIIACGKIILAKLETRIEKKQLFIPENMILTSFAPQIDILKRASLFITHCGMNSTSEAIHYGVPIVCLPVSADQPRVAYRVADELGLGVRLNLKKLTQASVKDAVKEIMTDSGYQERMLRFSELSRSYNGVTNATKEIFDYVERTKAAADKKDN